MTQKSKKKNKEDVLLGQYFTTQNILKEQILQFILNEPTTILEPCIGQGDLVTFIINKLSTVIFDMYEIDSSIKLLDGMEIHKDKIVYCDFLKHPILKTYKTIVGNPPYIRTKKGNLYIEFIEKCYHLLEEKGELIFIVPSDFFKLTCASKLLNQMMEQGNFTHIFHPHKETFFENASIDIIIFRYCKNIYLEKQTLYNNQLRYTMNNNGLITFSENKKDSHIIFKHYFDIYVGMVSGKEEVYKNDEYGNIEVLTGEDKTEKYIYIQKFPCLCEKTNQYLLKHKQSLMKRGIREFNDNNWFEWGALRNFTSINKSIGEECIYIYTITRKTNVAFLGKVAYFGGGLIMLKPKIPCDLNKFLSYLNSDSFKHNFLFSGRFKIGHRQISYSSIPNECL